MYDVYCKKNKLKFTSVQSQRLKCSPFFTGRDLKHCVLALSAAESGQEDLVTTNTIGFVVV